MSSTAGSTLQSADRVTRAAVVLHGRPAALGSGLERLETVAAKQGVELVMTTEDAQEGVRAFIERRETEFRGW